MAFSFFDDIYFVNPLLLPNYKCIYNGAMIAIYPQIIEMLIISMRICEDRSIFTPELDHHSKHRSAGRPIHPNMELLSTVRSQSRTRNLNPGLPVTRANDQHLDH